MFYFIVSINTIIYNIKIIKNIIASTIFIVLIQCLSDDKKDRMSKSIRELKNHFKRFSHLYNKL